MKVLIIGGGGREHAIAWKLSQSSGVSKLYCAPGNAGISQIAVCVPIKALEIEKIVSFSTKEQIDLVVVAPDDPLAAGLVNRLEEEGIRAFGPRKEAAILESSKVFSKNLMQDYKIPTAAYAVFENSDKALSYLHSCSFPIVIKCDGLALGKGVVIAQNYEEAMDAVLMMMEEKQFGESGKRIVIEEFIEGPEVSILAFTDGKTLLPMVSSKDHKRALDQDQGPNTGGMGTLSPNPDYSPEMAERCMQEIFLPTLEAMNKEGRTFKGVIYFGLMLTKQGPKVLEYNARFGDPETQVVLPRLETDLLEIFLAVIEERLHEITITWRKEEAVCVIAASGGYPGHYGTGYPIQGLETQAQEGIYIFHAGTRYENNQCVSAGGRVLGVTALGETLEFAAEKVYNAIKKIDFKDMHYRKDIGRKT